MRCCNSATPAAHLKFGYVALGRRIRRNDAAHNPWGTRAVGDVISAAAWAGSRNFGGARARFKFVLHLSETSYSRGIRGWESTTHAARLRFDYVGSLRRNRRNASALKPWATRAAEAVISAVARAGPRNFGGDVARFKCVIHLAETS